MRDPLKSIISGLVFVIQVVGVIAVSFAGICMVWTFIYAGTLVEYEGTVQAVTRSNFLAPNTYVVMRTYSEDDVHFTLSGYHDFDIGVQYKVSLVMRPYVFGLVCWGDLRSGGIKEATERN